MVAVRNSILLCFNLLSCVQQLRNYAPFSSHVWLLRYLEFWQRESGKEHCLLVITFQNLYLCLCSGSLG